MKTQAWQFDFFGQQHTLNSPKTIASNLRKLLVDNPQYRLQSKNDEMVWAYLQEFHGIGDAISREQFFALPKIDSIRRAWLDVVKEDEEVPVFNN